MWVCPDIKISTSNCRWIRARASGSPHGTTWKRNFRYKLNWKHTISNFFYLVSMEKSYSKLSNCNDFLLWMSDLKWKWDGSRISPIEFQISYLIKISSNDVYVISKSFQIVISVFWAQISWKFKWISIYFHKFFSSS